jgi:citrate lyase subunit beta / citryl-CoA lyase
VVLLPKVEGPAQIWAADAVASAVEADHGLAPGSILFYPILETAQALRSAYDIVSASPRVTYMGGAVSRFGDIVQSTGFVWTPGGRESLMFRSWVLADCRAAGMAYPMTGGSSVGDDDLHIVRRWAEEGRALGYRGSQVRVFEPHVAIVNEVYSPTAEELAGWRALVASADAGSVAPGADRAVALARSSLDWAAAKVLSN